MNVEETYQGDYHVKTVTGEVDLATAPALAEALANIENSGAVVADLTEVDFIDTSGLNVLLAAFKAAEERGSRFVVVAPNGPVRRVLDLTGLVKEITVVDSLSDIL